MARAKNHAGRSIGRQPGYKVPEEVLVKMREAGRRQMADPNMRAQISASIKRTWATRYLPFVHYLPEHLRDLNIKLRKKYGMGRAERFLALEMMDF